MRTTGFIGFPERLKPVIVPDAFFTELLPQIDDLAELKLTLHCFWLLNEQEGPVKYLLGDNLRRDERLLAPDRRICRGERAVLADHEDEVEGHVEGLREGDGQAQGVLAALVRAVPDEVSDLAHFPPPFCPEPIAASISAATNLPIRTAPSTCWKPAPARSEEANRIGPTGVRMSLP